MSAFRVGQKVVCVDADSGRGRWVSPNSFSRWVTDGLTVGAVYTVRRVGVDPMWGSPALWLEEIDRGIDPTYGAEPGFHQRRFKPVAHPKQSAEHDAETFRKIAAQLPAPTMEPVE